MSIDNGRKTDRGWEFSDQVDFKVLDYNQQSFEKVQDDYMGAFKPQTGEPHPSGLGTQPGTETVQPTQVNGNGLVIRLAATHAGLVTRNNGFYLPDKMRDGAKTFTELYPKPIQVHHEDHKDPVGRVVQSRYVETVGQVVDRFKNHVLRDSRKKDIGRADSDFWKDFCGSDKSFIEKLQMVKLIDSVLGDKHYRGVGFIELTADITDPDAIQKVLDGRFLTGSVGAISDKAVCSICSTNWLDEEHCGHRPGKVYEDKKCFVIAGSLDYDEYSFVNTPADRHSGVLSIESNGILDSVKDKKASMFLYPVADYFHKEDSAMDIDTKADDDKVKDEVKTSEESGDEPTVKAEENAKVEAEVKDTAETVADSEDSSETNKEVIQDDNESKGDVLPILDKIFSVQDGQSYDFNLTDEESLLLNDAFNELLEDKLSVEDREKLPKSSFCGPDMSLPVVDCAHVNAVLKLMDSSTVESAKKSSVYTSVSRKAKAMGCDCVESDSKVEDSAKETPEEVEDSRLTADLVRSVLNTLDLGLYGNPWDEESMDEAPALKDKEINQLKQMIISLAERIGEDGLRKALALTGLVVVQDEFDAQVAESTRLEDKLGNKNDQLTALRQELRATYSDIEVLTDQLVNANHSLRSQKIARLENLHTLEGTLTDDLKDNFSKISDEVLDNSLETISGKVDMVRIADKVNDGLSRTPKETVDNPTEVTTPSVTEETKDQVDTKPTFRSQDWADNEYRRILVQEQNPIKAKSFYKDAVARGFAQPKPDLDN